MTAPSAAGDAKSQGEWKKGGGKVGSSSFGFRIGEEGLRGRGFAEGFPE